MKSDSYFLPFKIHLNHTSNGEIKGTAATAHLNPTFISLVSKSEHLGHIKEKLQTAQLTRPTACKRKTPDLTGCIMQTCGQMHWEVQNFLKAERKAEALPTSTAIRAAHSTPPRMPNQITANISCSHNQKQTSCKRWHLSLPALLLRIYAISVLFLTQNPPGSFEVSKHTQIFWFHPPLVNRSWEDREKSLHLYQILGSSKNININ